MDLPTTSQPASKIDRAVVDAVLSGRMKAGMRLGELQLGQLFGVSRTIVREALIRLETRGIVQASAPRLVRDRALDRGSPRGLSGAACHRNRLAA
jgi:DNA-binding GntR family transcriptional regulator